MGEGKGELHPPGWGGTPGRVSGREGWGLMIFAIAQMASLVAQLVKSPTTMRETWVRSLGQKDPLEKEMASHSSILAWRIPWMEEPGGLQSTGSKSLTRLSNFTHSLTHSMT